MIKIDLRVTRDIGDRMPENMYITGYAGWMDVSISKALRDVNAVLHGNCAVQNANNGREKRISAK